MKTGIVKKCIGWVSVGLIVVGIVCGGIGVYQGGLHTINFAELVPKQITAMWQGA